MFDFYDVFMIIYYLNFVGLTEQIKIPKSLERAKPFILDFLGNDFTICEHNNNSPIDTVWI